MSNKLKAYIVDDEIKAVELVRTYIERIDFLDCCGDSRNPMRAFGFLKNNPIDVLFLDINMPLLSGVELYKSLEHPPAVIFTTAYPEFAVEGFNLEAVDYLLKPISFHRFLLATERLLKRKSINQPNLKSPSLLADTLYVKSGATTYKLSWREILFLEKDENYVIYHTVEKRILSRQTLSDLETVFPSYFCRIHKSYAVSLLHIQEVEREFLKVNNQILKIGRTYRGELLKRLA